jgi:uncharacterized protein
MKSNRRSSLRPAGPPAPAGTPLSETQQSPWPFVTLTFLLSIPFQLVGAFAEFELMPGLPPAALIFICPTVSALILVHRSSGRAGMRQLLLRALDGARIGNKLWVPLIVLLAPGVFVLSYLVLLWRGVPLPETQFDPWLTLGLGAVFLVSALGEELGWSGYAIDTLQRRWGAFSAAVILGLVWAAFHLVALIQAHRPPTWIAWWALGTVALRVIITWIYFNTRRSVFAASVVHATHNAAWQLFPVRGSHYDPQVTSLILVAVAIAMSRDARTLISTASTHEDP